jgi:hypothetical protein
MSGSISSRIQFLIQFHLLPENAYDFVFPQGPKFSKAAQEVLIAQIIRDIAVNVQQFGSFQSQSAALSQIGRELATGGISGLLAGYEDGDDWCGTGWPGKWPFPPRQHFGIEDFLQNNASHLSQTIQPQENLKTYVSALRYLANHTTNKALSTKIQNVARDLGNVSSLKAA